MNMREADRLKTIQSVVDGLLGVSQAAARLALLRSSSHRNELPAKPTVRLVHDDAK